MYLAGTNNHNLRGFLTRRLLLQFRLLKEFLFPLSALFWLLR